MDAVMGVLLAGAIASYFLLSRLSGNHKRPRVPIGELPGHGKFAVDVVGESKYQSALSTISGGKTADGAEHFVKATLHLEDANPYDEMAVRVEIDGKTVGYLSRENARQYRAQLKRAGHENLIGRCDAVIRGGWDRGRGKTGHFGVKLDLPAT
jgi:hypothetical protein